MRRVLLSFIFFVAAYTAFSQRIYFIYLQTESQQPFFVKMDEKLYSSTASGYLILSRLKDSAYTFTIGFPNNQSGEQKFNCLINHKDHGYLVKNYGDKGWGLLDLQTNTVQMAANNTDKNGVSFSNAPVNAFTELLAKAADDSTLKQKVVFTEEKKAETVAKVAEKKPDSSLNTIVNKTTDTPKQVADSVKKQDIAVNNLPKQPATSTNTNKESTTIRTAPDSVVKPDQGQLLKKNEQSQPVAGVKAVNEVLKTTEDKVKQDTQSAVVANTEVESFAKSKVIRKSESSTTEGFGITYVDIQPNGRQDTIKILIPNTESKVQTAVAEEKTNDTSIKKSDEAAATPAVNTIQKSTSKNSCKQVASDADFYKLRKKMAGEKSDNAMVDEANKLFKTKCFTTNQIKNLGTLFLGDGGKYNFFDVAYQHVSDIENFPALQSELKDEYFVNRFKAMLR